MPKQLSFEYVLAQPVGAIEVGNYADLVVLDLQQSLFMDVSPTDAMDAWLIGGSSQQIAGLYVGGGKVL